MTRNGQPSVDVNLQKNKACFSWTDVPAGNSESIFYDSEWLMTGVDNHRIGAGENFHQVRKLVIR